MNSIFIWITMIILGVFFSGLLIYSFYIVIFSKKDHFDMPSRPAKPAKKMR